MKYYKIDTYRQREIERDLGIGIPFVKGEEIPVRKCWHCYTDGNSTDTMFYDEIDFTDGMNRIYVVALKYQVIILAFCLMDNHVHFILYGELSECEAFINEYLRRTSQYIRTAHGEQSKLERVPARCDSVNDQRYLKTAICYTIKNPSSAGMKFSAWDYPWSSGMLYFRSLGTWCSPALQVSQDDNQSQYQLRRMLKTKESLPDGLALVGNIIFPYEYVAVDLVEKVFRTTKVYTYFLGSSRDQEIEEKAGAFANMSIPDQELRKAKAELCLQKYGRATLNSIPERVELARVLRSKYGCSTKQLARVCGLRYDELVKVI